MIKKALMVGNTSSFVGIKPPVNPNGLFGRLGSNESLLNTYPTNATLFVTPEMSLTEVCRRIQKAVEKK